MESFSIQNLLQFKPYKNLLLSIVYRKWVIWLYLLLTLTLILYAILLIIKEQYENLDSSFWTVFAFFGVANIYFPIVIWWSAYKTFKNKDRITENINYTFSNEGLNVNGESFNSNFTWDKVFKVRRLKNWLLIYHNKRVFNPVNLNPKNETDIENLRAYLKDSGFKIKLKF